MLFNVNLSELLVALDEAPDSVFLGEGIAKQITFFVGDELDIADSGDLIFGDDILLSETMDIIDNVSAEHIVKTSAEVVLGETLNILWPRQAHGMWAVRDGWEHVRWDLLPDMYKLPQWSNVFKLVDRMYGDLYDKILNRIDSLIYLTSLNETDEQFVKDLARLVDYEMDTSPVASQILEIRNAVDIYKTVGTAGLINRTLRVKKGVDSSNRYPVLEEMLMSQQATFSATGYIGDKLFFNHHVIQVLIPRTISDVEELLKDMLPAGVKVWFGTTDVVAITLVVARPTVVDWDDIAIGLKANLFLVDDTAYIQQYGIGNLLENTWFLIDHAYTQADYFRRAHDHVNLADQAYAGFNYSQVVSSNLTMLDFLIIRRARPIDVSDTLTTLDEAAGALVLPYGARTYGFGTYGGF